MKSKGMILLVVCILLGVVFGVPSQHDMADHVWKAAESPAVVLDPGNGGMDGGAESADGTVEKDINLAIALKLRNRLEAEKLKVVMTRDGDKGLYDDSEAASIRSMKTQDMKERKRIIDESGAELAVSIHLNSFTQDRSVKGAQVFFSSDADEDIVRESEAAAHILQQLLNREINTDKKRSELGKSDVFILRAPAVPVVIVECGFLSNREDAENLENEDFQDRIAEELCRGICDYVNRDKCGNQ